MIPYLPSLLLGAAFLGIFPERSTRIISISALSPTLSRERKHLTIEVTIAGEGAYSVIFKNWSMQDISISPLARGKNFNWKMLLFAGEG